MPAAPITVQLSKFEQIEILRAEIDKREEELKHVERQIREVLFEIERQKFLQTVHALFHQLKPPELSPQLPHLNAQRDALADAIHTMNLAMEMLQKETAGQAAPPPRAGLRPAAGASAPAPGGARKRFDSFDDFKSNRSGPS